MDELTVANSNLLDWLKSNWLLILFFAGLASAFIFLRSRPSEVGDVSELNGLLTDGQPTIIEFYSNF